MNGLSVIRECGSTLYRLEHVVPPTNTKFRLLLLQTQAGMPYTNTHKHKISYFKSKRIFLGSPKHWKSISAARQNRNFLHFFIINTIIIFNSFSISIRWDSSALCTQCLQNLYQSVAINLKYMLLVLLLHLKIIKLEKLYTCWIVRRWHITNNFSWLATGLPDFNLR